MPPSDDIDDARIHVLERGGGGRGVGTWLGVALLLAVAGAGAWVVLTDPFTSEAARVTAPPPAPGNLLGDGWSFETTETTSPSQAWVVPDGVPAGFAFVADAAVSGQAGASWEPGEAAWARMLTAEAHRVGPRVETVQLTAEAAGDGLQLVLRFEGEGLPALDVVVASGSGRLVGHARPPPGYGSVRAGFGAVNAARVDDLDLRLLTADDADAREPPRGMTPEGADLPGADRLGDSIAKGLYEVRVGDPRGVSVFRADALVLRLEPPTLRLADGRMLPSSAALLPGTGEVVGADGERVRFEGALVEEGVRLVLEERLDGVPEGVTVVHTALVTGGLAEQPLGIRSARRFERFSGDFRVEGVDALLLGGTQDRLAIEMGEPYTLSATRRADGSVALALELEGHGAVSQRVVLQAEFKEERVVARQMLDEASDLEEAGRLGASLAQLDRIVQETPYDDLVLDEALAARARLQAGMQAQLDGLDADLEDALFLGSATRCREVREEALAVAARYEGSEARALFEARAAAVEERAAKLLAEDRSRRRERLEALADSFEAHGGYPRMTRELRDTLDRFLPAGDPAEGER